MRFEADKNKVMVVREIGEERPLYIGCFDNFTRNTVELTLTQQQAEQLKAFLMGNF